MVCTPHGGMASISVHQIAPMPKRSRKEQAISLKDTCNNIGLFHLIDTRNAAASETRKEKDLDPYFLAKMDWVDLLVGLVHGRGELGQQLVGRNAARESVAKARPDEAPQPGAY
eukprot:scaffold12990_cov38-Prasinocladus_malaysianus.AAC.1